MQSLPDFEVFPDYAHFRPKGRMTSLQVAARATAAIRFAVSGGVRRLLLDTSLVEQLTPLSVPDRFFIIEEFAGASRPSLAVAIVLPQSMIDPEKFGVTAAKNRGLNADVFPSVEKALAWLLRDVHPPS